MIPIACLIMKISIPWRTLIKFKHVGNQHVTPMKAKVKLLVMTTSPLTTTIVVETTMSCLFPTMTTVTMLDPRDVATILLLIFAIIVNFANRVVKSSGKILNYVIPTLMLNSPLSLITHATQPIISKINPRDLSLVYVMTFHKVALAPK